MSKAFWTLISCRPHHWHESKQRSNHWRVDYIIHSAHITLKILNLWSYLKKTIGRAFGSFISNKARGISFAKMTQNNFKNICESVLGAFGIFRRIMVKKNIRPKLKALTSLDRVLIFYMNSKKKILPAKNSITK